MKIISFSGKKQSGKTTAVNSLAMRLGYMNCVEVHFADVIKEITQRCFGASPAETDGTNAHKDQILECGRTCRQVMQDIGTMLCSIDPSALTNAYLWKIAQLPYNGPEKTVLTGDVRKPIEATLIQQLGGVVIRLTRSPHPDDTHYSEVALDDWEGFDYVLDNSAMTIDEQNDAIWKLVCERNWF